MWGILSSIDWTATGVLLIGVWQAVKEWRTKAVRQPSRKARPPLVERHL